MSHLWTKMLCSDALNTQLCANIHASTQTINLRIKGCDHKFPSRLHSTRFNCAFQHITILHVPKSQNNAASSNSLFEHHIRKGKVAPRVTVPYANKPWKWVYNPGKKMNEKTKAISSSSWCFPKAATSRINSLFSLHSFPPFFLSLMNLLPCHISKYGIWVNHEKGKYFFR